MQRVLRTTVIGIFCLALGPALAGDAQPGSIDCDQPRTSGGWMAYLDPATGTLVAEPPFGKPMLKMTPEALYPFSTSHFGLFERKLPNGLTKVNLQGRFRQGTVATVDAQGNVTRHRIGGEIFLSPAGRCAQGLLHQRPSREEQS